MEALVPIIIQAISGMVGGGVVGALVKQAAIALVPRLIAGAVGGVGGGLALGPLIASAMGGDAGSAMDASGIIGNIIAGAGGGGVLTAIAGAVMGRK